MDHGVSLSSRLPLAVKIEDDVLTQGVLLVTPCWEEGR